MPSWGALCDNLMHYTAYLHRYAYPSLKSKDIKYSYHKMWWSYFKIFNWRENFSEYKNKTKDLTKEGLENDKKLWTYL